MTFRSGIGIDVHPLVPGRPLVLGGVEIPYENGLSGHSDGDVLIHAVIDALLGGVGLGDIGTHFSSDDPEYEGIASGKLLDRTVGLLAAGKWRIENVDATIMAERPRLRPYMDQMKQALASSLRLDLDALNLKAKSGDGLGFVGRGEGIAALAIATLEKVP